MTALNLLRSDNIPNIEGNEIIVDKPTWDNLIKYLETQTNAILELSKIVENSIRLNDTRNQTVTQEISNIKNQITVMATALKGVYSNE